MLGRPTGRYLAQSPLEAIAIPVLIAAVGSIGLLWGVGVVIGSILGSTLPGSAGESVLAMLDAFPDVGAAWQPSLPSPLVWIVAAVVAASISPLLWRLSRAGHLHDQGAQWATTHDLRRVGLLATDRTLPYAVPEPPSASDAE